MRRALLIWGLLLAGIVCIAQSERVNAFWQSRDSNYNIAISGSPPPSTTTWDPSNIGAGITLSGGNLTATAGTGGAVYVEARSVANHSTGKYYAEVTVNSYSSNELVLGVGNASALAQGALGFDSNLSIGDWPGCYINSAQVNSSCPGFAATNVVGIALDAGGQLFWIAVNGGNWNGSALANPATGIGGVDVSAITGPYYLSVTIKAGLSLGVTANFGATSYSFTAPVGFGNW